jgi:hypothetical protein
VVVAIKVVHTLAWASIESCVLYVLFAGMAGRTDKRVGIASAVVAGESLVFAASGFRCPLTELAERYGAERGSVTDIYLPKRFAHSIPAIHAPLLVLITYLHARNLRRSRYARTTLDLHRDPPDPRTGVVVGVLGMPADRRCRDAPSSAKYRAMAPAGWLVTYPVMPVPVSDRRNGVSLWPGVAH